MNLREPLTNIRAMRIFYWLIRAGMGLSFIISGLRKWPGVKFTALPAENPVGAYFHAMHETGFYWNCIGYFQIAVGLLIYELFSGHLHQWPYDWPPARIERASARRAWQA